MLANTQNSVIINKRKDLMISKTGLIGMADRRVLIQLKKNISNVWTVGQFDIGQLRCGSSPVQHFESSKLSDKQDVGPARRAHVNGRIDMPINAQKSLETIFIQEFLKVENQK